MTLLSICIPVFGRSPGSQAAVTDAVRQMLGNARDDFQIVIGDFSRRHRTAVPLCNRAV
jgi:hypothetical protein